MRSSLLGGQVKSPGSMHRLRYLSPSNGPSNHELLYLANRLCGVKTFGANIDAVHDGVAPKESIRVLKIVQSMCSSLVTTISNESVGLQ